MNGGFDFFLNSKLCYRIRYMCTKARNTLKKQLFVLSAKWLNFMDSVFRCDLVLYSYHAVPGLWAELVPTH